MLDVSDLSYRLGKKYLLQPTTARFSKGNFHVIMGANGAGKSTMLKLLAGDLKPGTGTIVYDGKPISQYSKQDLARKRAVLSQHYAITFPIRVEDLVLMGRYPFFQSLPGDQDLAICYKAMDMMNVMAFKDRDYQSLSGGESQKVQMSRVLAQIWEQSAGNEKILFLDEPVSHLDIKYQHQLLKAAKELCRQHTTVIAVLHDINLAIAYADRLLFLKEGRVLYDLAGPSEVTTDLVGQVFDVASTIIYPGKKPVVIF